MTAELLAAYFRAVAESVPWWLLWVGACVGHGYLFIVALNVFYGWPLPHNQCFQVEFTEKTIALPQLPDAWDGLTILHLTDLHLCGTPDRAFFHYVMDRCMQAGVPDLIAMTGDVVDSEWHHRWIVPVL